MIDLAADNGWQGYLVKRELKNMQWSTAGPSVGGGSSSNRKTGMVAEFSDLALHFEALANVSEQDLNDLQVCQMFCPLYWAVVIYILGSKMQKIHIF